MIMLSYFSTYYVQGNSKMEILLEKFCCFFFFFNRLKFKSENFLQYVFKQLLFQFLNIESIILVFYWDVYLVGSIETHLLTRLLIHKVYQPLGVSPYGLREVSM